MRFLSTVSSLDKWLSCAFCSVLGGDGGTGGWTGVKVDGEVVKLQQENKRQRQDREGDREERQRVGEVVNNLWQAVDCGKGGRCEVQPVPAYWDDGHASNHYTGIAPDTSHPTHTRRCTQTSSTLAQHKHHIGCLLPVWICTTKVSREHQPVSGYAVSLPIEP